MKTTYAGTAKGTPSTTETILSEPDYEVAIGDEIMIDVGTNEFETVAITNVSGNAGSDVTLTHAAVSVAASADDTVYIIRDRCAGIGDSIALTIEMTRETINCMQSSSGKQASTFTERSVTVEKTPYFKSWQEFLLRDAVVGTELTIVLGSATYNTMVLYMPNVINAEVELGAETLMKNNVSGRAVIGSRLGEGYELAIAHF